MNDSKALKLLMAAVVGILGFAASVWLAFWTTELPLNCREEWSAYNGAMRTVGCETFVEGMVAAWSIVVAIGTIVAVVALINAAAGDE